MILLPGVMSAQDPDSSSEDERDYKTTNVTLGYASTEALGDDISHIGGHPVLRLCIPENAGLILADMV